jgi:ribosomal protein S18 acetylase RimI-like enzyme
MPLSRITRTESLELTAEDVAEIHGLRLRAADFFAEVGDVPPTFASLEADLGDLPEGFARANEAIYRGYDGEQLVGYAEVLRGWPARDSWVIGILLVDSGRRGEGVGHEIAEAVALDAKARAVRSLLVGVISSRERSLSFWKREGYAREVLRRQLSIGDVEHEIIRLERKL